MSDPSESELLKKVEIVNVYILKPKQNLKAKAILPGTCDPIMGGGGGRNCQMENWLPSIKVSEVGLAQRTESSLIFFSSGVF